MTPLFYSLCSLFLVVAPLSGGESPHLWEKSESKRCSIRLPTTPHRTSHQIQDHGGLCHYEILMSPIESYGVCIFIVAEYPELFPKEKHQETLEHFLSWIIAQSPESELTGAQLRNFLNHQALDFMLTTQNVVFSSRLILSGNRIYFMGMEMPSEYFDPNLFLAYVESLDLF